MPLRRKLWIGISFVLPIAFTVITLTRPTGPPEPEVEVVPMPAMPAITRAGGSDGGAVGSTGPDAGTVDAGSLQPTVAAP